MAKIGDIISGLDISHRYFLENTAALRDMSQGDDLAGKCAAHALLLLELYKADRLVYIDRHGKGVRLGAVIVEVSVAEILERWAKERQILSDVEEEKEIGEPADPADIEYDEEARDIFLARAKEEQC